MKKTDPFIPPNVFEFSHYIRAPVSAVATAVSKLGTSPSLGAYIPERNEQYVSLSAKEGRRGEG